MSHNPAEYDAWYAELQREAARFDYPVWPCEAWREAYEDGTSPAMALADDMACADWEPLSEPNGES